MRKFYRTMVRLQAQQRGEKASAVVKDWRRILSAYPGFEGVRHQHKNSKQPVLVYPIPQQKSRWWKKKECKA